jgi:hypothetical protein
MVTWWGRAFVGTKCYNEDMLQLGFGSDTEEWEILELLGALATSRSGRLSNH